MVCNSATEGKNGRASFTHYTGTGGDNEFTNSLVIVDYFFGGEFFVGAGIASMQLTNSSAGSSTSASATSPVLQVGYTENLTKNIQLSIGVLQYSSGLSLSHSTTPTTNSLQETQTAIGDTVTLGTTFTTSDFGVQSWTASGTCCVAGMFLDNRVEVTQVGERTVNIEEIITPAGAGQYRGRTQSSYCYWYIPALQLLTKLAFCLARLCACLQIYFFAGFFSNRKTDLFFSNRKTDLFFAKSLQIYFFAGFFCYIFFREKNRKQKQKAKTDLFFSEKKTESKKVCLL